MCGRRLLTLSLVLFFSAQLFSQQTKPIEFTLSTNPWIGIDLTLSMLEEQTTDMQTLIEEQQKQILNLENAYQNTYLLYLNSENNLEQLEQDMNKCKKFSQTWKTVGLVSLGVTVLTIVGAIVGVSFSAR